MESEKQSILDSALKNQGVTQDPEDAIVCFCYKYSARQLKELHNQYGSLKVLQEKTGVGNGCGGCRLGLNAIFNEETADINKLDHKPIVGSSCSKPGSRLMKGFVIADGNLESTIYSANCTAPQLGNCDSSTTVSYGLVDGSGKLVFERQATLKTNETFIFETKNEILPRPFYGMFLMNLGRQNFGAARFNIYWSNANGTTATHENSSTGRPMVVLPVIFDDKFLAGPNTLHLAIYNPHQTEQKFTISAFDVDSHEALTWESELNAFNTTWLDASENILRPALAKNPNGRFSVRIATKTLQQHGAVTVYFFFHNKVLDLWSSNHL